MTSSKFVSLFSIFELTMEDNSKILHLSKFASLFSLFELVNFPCLSSLWWGKKITSLQNLLDYFPYLSSPWGEQTLDKQNIPCFELISSKFASLFELTMATLSLQKDFFPYFGGKRH